MNFRQTLLHNNNHDIQRGRTRFDRFWPQEVLHRARHCGEPDRSGYQAAGDDK